MSLSIGRGIAAALSGTLTGLASAAEKEDAKREELTKLGLANRMKNIEKARELQQEQQAARKKQDEFVSNFAGKFGFMDEDTQKVQPLSEAQAIELYAFTNGDAEKALKLMQDGSIRFSGVGEVKEVAPLPGLSTDSTLAAFEGMDDGKGLFAAGRYASVQEEIDRQTRSMGMSGQDLSIPQLRQAIGTGIQIAERRDSKIHRVGTFEWTNQSGVTETAEGFIGTDGNRVMYDTATGEQVPVPAGSVFTTKATRTQEVTTLDERYWEIDGKISNTDFKASRQAVQAAVNGTKELKITYDAMTPYALDKAVYSASVTILGGLIAAGEKEIFGIKYIFNDAEGRDRAADIAKLDSFIEENRELKTPAARANVLAAMQLRAAYAFLKAEGDTRPSDADIQRALQQFSAKTPEEFVMKATENWSLAKEKLNVVHDSYISRPEFELAREFANQENANGAAYQQWIDVNLTSVPVIDDPLFMSEEVQEQAKQASVRESGSVQVTLKNGVEATIKDGKVILPGAPKVPTVQEAVAAGLLDESSIPKED